MFIGKKRKLSIGTKAAAIMLALGMLMPSASILADGRETVDATTDDVKAEYEDLDGGLYI